MMKPILIAGPTASGKSSLALELAEILNGCVVNADALQVYADWRVLTARPSIADEKRAPHLLYGHVDAAKSDYSVGSWLREVSEILGSSDGPAIITGGTGLYFSALTKGLAPIPAIPAKIRAAGEALQKAGQLEAELRRRDPQTAAAIAMDNPRRVLRAWEVLEATGEGLSAWIARTPAPILPPEAAIRIRLAPDREALYANCDKRFSLMLAQGALEEVQKMQARNLPPESPAQKALGAKPLREYLAGALSLEDAAAQAAQDTRRYAKRQLTWGRRQMGDWASLPTPSVQAALAIIKG